MMKVPKRRNCKVCGLSFKPVKITDWACCSDHQVEYALSLVAKNREKQKKSAEALRRSQGAREKKEIRQRKFVLSTPQKQASEAQAAFNGYIRARDFGKPCISCGCEMDWYNTGSICGGGVDASHYRSVGAAKHLRFNTYNVHAACKMCNQHKSGNIAEYRPRLVNLLGEKIVQDIESDHSIRRFNSEYYARVIKIFRKKTSLIKKRRSHEMQG